MKKLSNFISLFQREFLIMIFLAVMGLIYVTGCFVLEEKMDFVPYKIVYNWLIGFLYFVKMFSVICITSLLVLVVISTIQLILYKTVFFIRICKNPFSIKNIDQKDYGTLRECLYDVIPFLCRKATLWEIWHEIFEGTRPFYNYASGYVYQECNYSRQILNHIKVVFSTTNMRINEFYIDKARIVVNYRGWLNIVNDGTSDKSEEYICDSIQNIVEAKKKKSREMKNE